MPRVETAILLCALTASFACSRTAPRSAEEAQAPVAARQDVDSQGGTGPLGPGLLFNACERIWCLTHERNFDLSHFTHDHVGWIIHDDGSGDVFVPKHRTGGPGFPGARTNVLALCGAHIHPYWLGAKRGPVTKTGYNVALGYDRAHFAAYGTRLMPAYLNAEAWGFLHAAAPREFRFGDRTAAEEMAGAGWQKAFPTRSTSAAALAPGAR